MSADVTHLRVDATVSIGRAQQLFGTSWGLYQQSGSSELVALPNHTPTLPSGLNGHVDTVAGMRATVTAHARARGTTRPRAAGVG